MARLANGEAPLIPGPPKILAVFDERDRLRGDQGFPGAVAGADELEDLGSVDLEVAVIITGDELDMVIFEEVRV